MPPPLTGHAGLAEDAGACARCVVHALAAWSASASSTSVLSAVLSGVLRVPQVSHTLSDIL
jgi:hypothetical protein